MPAIFSAEKKRKVWELYQKNYTRQAIADQCHIMLDDIDAWVFAAFKAHSTPMLKYKQDHSAPNLFSPAVAAKAPVQDMPQKVTANDRKAWATYSNQKQ